MSVGNNNFHTFDFRVLRIFESSCTLILLLILVFVFEQICGKVFNWVGRSVKIIKRENSEVNLVPKKSILPVHIQTQQ